ncbi:YbaK/EbsC family protein [Cognatazoarcus halotolerans]|uniref:YbaK/EbsC family protein n=1 Tax=Cognatazoarcus halotolerans TaxID=2686016 RepID=UPI00135AFF08|nr:YbaK/EbsC family protein [Cognatazoarcus halotolerans]MBX3679040.1 YbaK/EbsC family protein [Rhodocyclaceae bacterium]MCB1899905.1 YbaK/EbsC family protein [Rhodocyclaceae bacterium]MCP5308183.1 YbaK/EbsC family protein [Zoogloeaceae bacterium]
MNSPVPAQPISSVQRVEQALAALGIETSIIEFAASTRTAVDAAREIGCDVAQIAKSIVLRGLQDDTCVLVIASGASRVDEHKVATLVGQPVAKADATFVRARTGFAIGGVAPVGHLGAVTVLVDEGLWSLDPIWAAAGAPNAVFCLSADDLHRIPEIRVGDVARQT